ncbi:hypothetical protein FQR65_LT17456 [Abscondita terminalis]|nr:hypothetical protein FQR65_LT17456 [Abscondita terminalis]
MISAMPKKRKHVWILIAEQMAARNYIRDAVKLERKWTNLMRVYRAIKDNKGPKKSGRGGQNYKYFERIDEIVVNNEEITPVRVNDDEQTSSDFEVESIVHQKEMTGVLTNGSKRRKSNSVTLNKQIMLEKAERHRELIEIEKEKLIIEKRKVELLEKLVMLQNKT